MDEKMGSGSNRPEEALREAHKVSRVGTGKWEIFVRKKGHKKLVVAYDAEEGEVFVITGFEG